MSTCVCVLSNSGERLMPTFRLGKVRRLLKDGKATKYNDTSATAIAAGKCKFVAKNTGILFV